MLYGSLILSMVISFFGTVFTTRYLSPNDYGDLKFIIILWYLLNIIISFGLFHSAGQLLLKERNFETIQKIIGAEILLALLLGIIIFLISFIISETIQIITKIPIAQTLRMVSPILVFYPLKDTLTLIFQCTNKIKLLSIFNILPPLFFLIFLIILPKFTTPDLIKILYGQYSIILLVSLFMIMYLRPKFRSFKLNLKNIIGYQKTYGVPVYISLLCSVATQQLNRLGLAYWIDNASVGYLSLASQLVDPIRLIPSAVATSSFRKFSTQSGFSKKLIWLTITIVFISFLGIFIFLGKPIEIFFTENYSSQISQLGKIAVIGAVFHGFGDLINRFLGSHGKGIFIRNASYFTGVTYLIGLIILTPLFGLWGAVSSQVLGSMMYFLIMLFYYKKFRIIYKWSK